MSDDIEVGDTVQYRGADVEVTGVESDRWGEMVEIDTGVDSGWVFAEDLE